MFTIIYYRQIILFNITIKWIIKYKTCHFYFVNLGDIFKVYEINTSIHLLSIEHINMLVLLIRCVI